MARQRQQCATEHRLRPQAHRRRHRLGALALLASILTASTYAFEPASLDALLDEAPSPAVDALLVAHADDPRVERRWRAGLDHDTALMRGTAARLLALEGSADSAPALRRALTAEADPHARGEIARALLVLGMRDDDRAVLEALRRVDPMARRRALGTLVAMRPDAVVADVRRAAGRSVVISELPSVLDALFDAGAPEADALMMAVALHPDTTGLSQLLATAARWQRRAPAEALETALHEPVVLPSALAYLATRDARERTQLAAALRVAPARADEARAADDRVLFGLRDRWLGHDGSSFADAIPDLRDGSAVVTLPDEVLRVLTRDERRALEQRFDMTSPVRQLLGRVAYQRAPRGADAARRHPVRLLSDLPAGLARALREATGCQLTASDDRVATIRYAADGRPLTIDLDTAGLSPGCTAYADALARLGWGPTGEEATPARMVLRLGDAACDAAARRPVVVAASARELAADLARPRKIAHRAPAYPRDLRGRGVAGTVLIDTRIDDAGCVASAQVVGSLDPVLDVEALRALSSWRYRPATLDGTPVPVQMDVAVQFVLR